MLKKSPEFAKFQLAQLDNRNTPPQGHSFSPVQRSMGRRTRQLLVSNSSCFPVLIDAAFRHFTFVHGEIQTCCQRAAAAYNDHHQVQSPLPDLSLEVGDQFYVKPPPQWRGHAWSYSRIICLVEPHICVADTSSGEVRRNRAQVHMAAPVLHHLQLFHRNHHMRQQRSVHRWTLALASSWLLLSSLAWPALAKKTRQSTGSTQTGHSAGATAHRALGGATQTGHSAVATQTGHSAGATQTGHSAGAT